MNDQIQILSDQVKSLLIVLDAILPAVKWEALPADTCEMVHIGIAEARESIGEAHDCAAGACQWQG